MSIYRLYDTDGALLYVGITSRGLRRLDEHAHAKPWWRQVARVEVEHHRSRAAAAKRERVWIARERPRYNLALVPPPPSPVRPGMSLGERIKAFREGRLWGQAELARAIGITANGLWKIEHGKERPRPWTVRAIAAALGVGVGELLEHGPASR